MLKAGSIDGSRDNEDYHKLLALAREGVEVRLWWTHTEGIRETEDETMAFWMDARNLRMGPASNAWYYSRHELYDHMARDPFRKVLDSSQFPDVPEFLQS